MTSALHTSALTSLPLLARGKVRDNYAVGDDRILMVASDRISAFDVIMGEPIPGKGVLLTQMALFWFDKLGPKGLNICPIHLTGDAPESVVSADEVAQVQGRSMLVKRLKPIPVEAVVRGYLAGTTSTSVLTQYKAGARTMYGHTLPDGLRDNQALPAAIITPTSKAFDGGHDEPLTETEIVAQGLLTQAQWDEVSSRALALFARGQKMAAERGLILVDTKYEFGTDAAGNILIADEIHTPDSSRYWIASGYQAAFEAGTRPPSFDKDVIRSWVGARCDPYKDAIPEIPAEMIAQTSQVYIDAYEMITGERFVPDMTGDTPLARVRANLAPYFG